ncbi:MAG TPA: alpha/beta hydrolase [Balneolales bacterium]|nr:alpha/beta hydrolase [Balneolales bacterium]
MKILPKLTIDNLIQIPAGKVSLEGKLIVPENAKGLVLFSHGSGSSRLSPRNNFVAEELHQQKFGTLLFDLLTEKEDRKYENRFDIALLTERLLRVTEWVLDQPELKKLPIGYFGASTGAASALKAAAKMGIKIKAIVSRGGRPDLAMDILDQIKSPTLLIVGGEDYGVLELNQQAFNRLKSEKNIAIVAGATHLFEEPGKLEEVAHLAGNWFSQHLK